MATLAIEAPASPPTDERSAVHPLMALAIIVAAVSIILFAVPRPTTVTVQGWRMLAIFVGTVLALMLRPIPGGAAVLIGVIITTLTGVLNPAQALAGYGSPTVWLVVCALFIARAIINTRLAHRLALIFIRTIGGTSLGLGYALVATDLVMATVVPGNSARVGGILLPISRSLAAIYNSQPGLTAGVLGSYLMLTIYQGDMIACAMYMTGQASNPIAANLAQRAFQVPITWSSWLWAASVPGLVAYAVVPWFVHKLCPPGVRETPQAAEMARAELVAMGPVSGPEKRVIVVFILVCGLWATSSFHNIQTTIVALVGVAVLVLTQTLRWSDVTHEHVAWDIFLWYGGLVRMGEALNDFGVMTAFAGSVSGFFSGWQWPALMAAVLLVYFYAHYFFASVTAHIIAMYGAFLAMLVAAGAPATLAAYSLAIYANLSASLTHYGTTPGPIVFAAGYVSHGTWWKVGFLVSVVNIAVWTSTGLLWWKLIGLW